LLQPHDEVVLNLLFILCTWHALAKLCLHTSSTIHALKATTKALGLQLRYWVKKTCSAFDTQELPKEESARHCRKAAATIKLGKKLPNPEGHNTEDREGAWHKDKVLQRLHQQPLQKRRQRVENHGTRITARYGNYSVCAHTNSMPLVITLLLSHNLGPLTATQLELYVNMANFLHPFTNLLRPTGET
jgi:hypothetical protein